MRKLMLLGIVMLGMGAVAQAQDVLTLSAGEPVTISISGTETVSAIYEGTAEEQVYITVTGAERGIEARVNVLGPNGGVVAERVQIGDRGWVLPFTIPETGRYTIAVQREEFSDFTGDATLLLDTITVPATELNETLTGSLDQALALAAFTFEAEPNTLFGYRLICTNECTFVMLPSDPAAEAILAGYFSERLFQPILLLPTGGTYTVYIQNATADTDYSLELFEHDPTPLSVNEPITGSIDSDQALIFAFESAAGKVWQVNGTFGLGGDRGIEIYRFENRPSWDVIVGRDYGTGPEGNPRITQFAAPEDGRYYVALYWRSNEAASSTDYTLNLSPDTLKQLAPGTTFTGELTAEGGQENYLYSGKAGDKIRITIERTSDTGSLNLRVVSEVDEVVVYYERGSTRAQFDITLPVDGRYQFTLSDVAYEVSVLGYAITLEPVEE
jgi:hypothetical protein